MERFNTPKVADKLAHLPLGSTAAVLAYQPHREAPLSSGAGKVVTQSAANDTHSARTEGNDVQYKALITSMCV